MSNNWWGWRMSVLFDCTQTRWKIVYILFRINISWLFPLQAPAFRGRTDLGAFRAGVSYIRSNQLCFNFKIEHICLQSFLFLSSINTWGDIDTFLKAPSLSTQCHAFLFVISASIAIKNQKGFRMKPFRNLFVYELKETSLKSLSFYIKVDFLLLYTFRTDILWLPITIIGFSVWHSFWWWRVYEFIVFYVYGHMCGCFRFIWCKEH